jgi:hypothetical protein
MSSGLDLRKRGLRRPGKTHGSGSGSGSGSGPLSALDHSSSGETRISSDVMLAIQHLYQTSPSIQSSRAILQGQLLSSGIRIKRQGVDVELKDTFCKHLEDVWIPFAKGVIDSFLQFGFVVVAIDEEDPPPFSLAFHDRQGPSSNAQHHDAAAARRKSLSVGASTSTTNTNTNTNGDENSGSSFPVQSSRMARSQVVNLAPLIPDLGTYQVSFQRAGRVGYKRAYNICTTSTSHAYQEDKESAIFIKTPPDPMGNINSPIASVFQSASFISALEELALNAEVVRARSQIVTQSVPRASTSSALDPSNLFFDSESRAIQSSTAAEDDQTQAQNLNLSVKLCNVLNRMQTTAQDVRSGAGSSDQPRQSHVPPEIPPRLFTVPERQQVVPNLRQPEARGDLVDLIRVVNEHSAPVTHFEPIVFCQRSISNLPL